MIRFSLQLISCFEVWQRRGPINTNNGDSKWGWNWISSSVVPGKIKYHSTQLFCKHFYSSQCLCLQITLGPSTVTGSLLKKIACLWLGHSNFLFRNVAVSTFSHSTSFINYYQKPYLGFHRQRYIRFSGLEELVWCCDFLHISIHGSVMCKSPTRAGLFVLCQFKFAEARELVSFFLLAKVPTSWATDSPTFYSFSVGSLWTLSSR